jgi:hypothetical protein
MKDSQSPVVHYIKRGKRRRFEKETLQENQPNVTGCD